MKKITIVVSISILLFIGILYYLQTKTRPLGTLRIGGAFALSGFASQWGEADRNGAMLAIEESNQTGGINGKRVEMIIEDTASDNTKTVFAVHKLVDVDGVQIILGPTWLDFFGGATPLAKEKQVILVTPSGAISAIKELEDYQYVFSTWYRSDYETRDLAQYLADNNQKRVALFFTND